MQRPQLTDQFGNVYKLGDYVRLPAGSYRAGRDFFSRTRLKAPARARIVGFDVTGFLMGHRNEDYVVALVLAVNNYEENLFVDPEDLECPSKS